MKKSTLLIIAALIGLLVTAFYTGVRNYQSTYVVVGGVAYDNSVTQMDLSGAENPDVDSICALIHLEKLDLRETGLSIAQYEQLRKALPTCEIAWQVPFQGQYLEPDTKQLSISSLNQEDLECLKYFSKLESIRAVECEDLDMIMALRELYPHVKITYRVALDGRKLPSSTKYVQVKDPDIRELQERLKYLPEMKTVFLTGKLPDNDRVFELVNAYPEISFRWNVKLLDMKFPNTSREIDISWNQLDGVEEVEAVLKYFPDLEKVIMCRCDLSNEVMDAFRKSQEKVKIVWSVKVRFFWVRTDATYLMPYQYGCRKLSNKDVDSLKYLTDLVCIDFGHMNITDLSFLYSMPDVKYLIVADCGVRDITPIGSLKKLEYLEIFFNSITDISPLAGCTELRDLNMCHNWVTDITPLLELEHLEHLWIKNNPLSWDQYEQLQEAFPDARIKFYSKNSSSTGDGWRQIPRYYEQRDYLGMWYTREY